MIMIDLMSVRFGMAAPCDVQIVLRYRVGVGRCKGVGARFAPVFAVIQQKPCDLPILFKIAPHFSGIRCGNGPIAPKKDVENEGPT